MAIKMTRIKRMAAAYKKFVSGYGFSLVVVVCIGVITATAVWTNNEAEPYKQPDSTPSDEMSAAAVQQENLVAAVKPTSVPVQEVHSWTAPLATMKVVRDFSPDVMVSYGYGGLWQTHDGIDLQTEAGEAVVSIGKGQITDCGSDPLSGAWVELDFGQGWSARYSGLSMLSAIRKGDRVSAGQTIGFAGDQGVHETDAGSFVHLSVYQNGASVDPMSLFGD